MDAGGVAGAGRDWSRWAKVVASLAIALHLVSILAAALATPPASPLEVGVAGLFSGYHQLIDQGYSYRYYAPEPPPTPVMEARLRFSDGRPEQTIRLPDRSTRPRMLYQRELALANHAFQEWNASRGPGGSEAPGARRWVASYARHLGRVHGCEEVVFYVTMHLIPPVGVVQRELAEGARVVDPDEERFYETPQLMGVYPCDGS